jgi:hypothetical protein
MFDVIPDGTYPAMIVQVVRRPITARHGLDIVLDVTYALLGHQTVCQGVLLDLTPAGEPDLSPGKNVELQRIRAAAGQSEIAAWTPERLVGAALQITVRLRVVPGTTDVLAYEVGPATLRTNS